MKSTSLIASALTSAASAQPKTKNFLRAALVLLLASSAAMPRGIQERNSSRPSHSTAPSHSAQPARNMQAHTPASKATKPAAPKPPVTPKSPVSSKNVNTNTNTNTNRNTNTNSNSFGSRSGSKGGNGGANGITRPGSQTGQKSGSGRPATTPKTTPATTASNSNVNTNTNTNTNINKNITINKFGGRDRQGSGREPQGGDVGRRISDSSFRSHFGRDHEFRFSHHSSSFRWGGVSFGLIQPVPVAWGDSDPVYVDYVAGNYVLCNRFHPGVQVPVNVSDCATCQPAPNCSDCASAPTSDDSGNTSTLTRGQTTDQVIATLGSPKSIVDLGVRQIYIYSDMKVTFLGGRLTDVR